MRFASVTSRFLVEAGIGGWCGKDGADPGAFSDGGRVLTALASIPVYIGPVPLRIGLESVVHPGGHDSGDDKVKMSPVEK